MLQLLRPFIETLQPYLVPICFVCAWAIVLAIVGNTVAAVRSSVRRAQEMHRIPCTDCVFFTNDYRLKCPVHPKTALSEGAIDCPDYRSSRPEFLDRLS
ncbi:hypothetical protein [Baaleninema sp.]|uniref:hypothetical protein n=1 Tax=Baaleninema sp. TaxID=3101197 RepID=UPI003D0045AD